MLMGIDFQVNDDDNSDDAPDAVIKLFDSLGTGYADPSLMETAILIRSSLSGPTATMYLGSVVSN
jgi:hypothetical protein